MAKWRYAYDEYHPWCTSGRVIQRSGADKHFELAAHCDMFDICLLIFGDLLQAYNFKIIASIVFWNLLDDHDDIK